MLVLMAEFDTASLALLKQFKSMLGACPFGKQSPFLYSQFNQDDMTNLITGQTHKEGDTRNTLKLFQEAMRVMWNKTPRPIPNSCFIYKSGAFELVFEDDEYRINVNAGVKATPIPGCDFPVEIKFIPHSSCICC
jgi:hypothetical protein